MIRNLIFCFMIGAVSARQFIPDLKAGTYGYMVDGHVVKTWSPEEFDEWRNANPLSELLVAVGHSLFGQGSQGSSFVGADDGAAASHGPSTGSEGGVASAVIRPAQASLPSAQETTDSSVTSSVVDGSTESADLSSTVGSSGEGVTAGEGAASVESSTPAVPAKVGKPQTIAESSYLDIAASDHHQEGEKTSVSDKDNEIDIEPNEGASTSEQPLATSPSSAVEGEKTPVAKPGPSPGPSTSVSTEATSNPAPTL